MFAGVAFSRGGEVRRSESVIRWRIECVALDEVLQPCLRVTFVRSSFIVLIATI